MVSSVQQASTNWHEAFTFAPFKEGAMRINKCIQGKDFNQIDHPTLSLKDRTFAVISGILLCIPALNAIIWIAMHVFGAKTALAVNSPPTEIDPWAEAIEASKKSPELEMAPIVAPAADATARKVEVYSMTNKVGNDPTYLATWEIEHHSDVYVVKSSSEKDTSTAIYDQDWALQSMHYTSPARNVDVEISRTGDTVRVVGTNNGVELDNEYPLPDPTIPWIQQPSIGVKPFVLSNEDSMQFYALNPKDMTLDKAQLTKTRREPVEGHPEWGNTVKIETSATTFPATLLGSVCESWFSVDKVKKAVQECRSKWNVPYFYSSDSVLTGKVVTRTPSREAVA